VVDLQGDILRSRSRLVIKMRVLAEKAALPDAAGGASPLGYSAPAKTASPRQSKQNI
jgi:hypothetical protein